MTTKKTPTVTYGYAVYAFPASLDWSEFDPYFKHISKAVGYAEYVGEFPPAEIPKSMTDAYPAESHKFVTSPRHLDDMATISMEINRRLNGVVA